MLETQTGDAVLSRLTLLPLPMCWRTQWICDVLLCLSTESKFSSFWNLILDEKKPLFTTEKFLSQANDESGEIYCIFFRCFHFEDISDFFALSPALLTVLMLCERLFLDHAHRFNSNKAKWERIISTVQTLWTTHYFPYLSKLFNFPPYLFSRMYHYATVAILLSRSWRVRKKAQQTVRKLLSSLGGSSFAYGLLGELRVVVNKHKVQEKEK